MKLRQASPESAAEPEGDLNGHAVRWAGGKEDSHPPLLTSPHGKFARSLKGSCACRGGLVFNIVPCFLICTGQPEIDRPGRGGSEL